MDKEDIKELIKKLKDYNILLIDKDSIGKINLSNVEIGEDYLYDLLDEETKPIHTQDEPCPNSVYVGHIECCGCGCCEVEK